MSAQEQLSHIAVSIADGDRVQILFIGSDGHPVSRVHMDRHDALYLAEKLLDKVEEIPAREGATQ